MLRVQFGTLVVAAAMALAGCGGLQKSTNVAQSRCPTPMGEQGTTRAPAAMDAAPNGEPTQMPPEGSPQCMNEP